MKLRIYLLCIVLVLTTAGFAAATKTKKLPFNIKERIHHGIDFMINVAYLKEAYTNKRSKANTWATAYRDNKYKENTPFDRDMQKVLTNIINKDSLQTTSIPFGFWVSSNHVLFNNVYANIQANFAIDQDANAEFTSFEEVSGPNDKVMEFELNASTAVGYIFWLNNRISLVPYIRLGFHGRAANNYGGTETNVGPFLRLDYLLADKWMIAPYMGITTKITQNYYEDSYSQDEPSFSPALFLGLETRYFMTDRVSLLLHALFEYRAFSFKDPKTLKDLQKRYSAEGDPIPIDFRGLPEADDAYPSYYKRAYDWNLNLGIGLGFHF